MEDGKTLLNSTYIIMYGKKTIADLFIYAIHVYFPIKGIIHVCTLHCASQKLMKTLSMKHVSKTVSQY